MLNCIRMLHCESNLLKSYATVDQYFDCLIHYPPTVQFNKAHFLYWTWQVIAFGFGRLDMLTEQQSKCKGKTLMGTH